MGTLYNQPPRDYLKVTDNKIHDFIADIKKMAKHHKLSVDQILYAYNIKELERKNDLFVRNGDAFDEQMSGIGDLLSQISSSMDAIASSMEEE